MRTSILLIFISLSLYLSGQSPGWVNGRLVDAENGQPIPSGNLSLVRLRDSSFLHSIADKNGLFKFNRLDTGAYQIAVTHQGFTRLSKNFRLTVEKNEVDLHDLYISREYRSLDEVTLRSESAIRVKDDTISFKMDAVKTAPGAMLEDALKKLPGIQVQKDGSIRAMGEKVQKLYVDGKEFFGNDPTVATKNLTADMVDQVQVFDDMSEQAKFTKLDDGSRAKTINIKLKKDRKKGQFGRVMAGAGTGNRYDGHASWNHFDDERKLSVTGSSGNTNKSSYNFGDPGSGSSQFSNGGMNSIAGGGSGGSGGIFRSTSVGINYNDLWSPRLDSRSSFQYSNSGHELEQSVFKRYSFPGDSIAETTAHTVLQGNNSNQRGQGRWEFAIDSFHSILYSANLSLQRSTSSYSDTSFTMAERFSRYLAVTASSERNETRETQNYGGELLYRFRSRKPGKTFTLGWKNGFSKNGSDHFFQNTITTYNASGTVLQQMDPNQHNYQDAKTNHHTLSAAFTHPLGTNKLIEFNYSYYTNKNSSDKKAFDFNLASGKYDRANLFQTNYLQYNQSSNRFGSNYRIIKKKYNYQLGASLQWSESHTRSVQAHSGKDTTIHQFVFNFFPAVNFHYTFNRSSNMRFYYRGRTNIPSAMQLQDVADLSNPLQVRIGNPDLRQEFISQFNLSYNHFNARSMFFFNGSLSVNSTGNKIVNGVDTAGGAILVIKPYNLDGALNSSGTFNAGWPIKKIRGASIVITTMGFFNRDVNLLYKTRNFATMLVIDQSLGFNYHKEKFDLAIAGSAVYNNLQYGLTTGSNTSYFRAAWSADLNYRFKDHFFILTDMDYFNYAGRTQGYNRSVLVWNMAVAKKFLASKAAEIKFTAYDILKQNKGISRNVGENYFEDYSAVVVPRFFLLSMTYNFHRSGSKKEPVKATENYMIFK